MAGVMWVRWYATVLRHEDFGVRVGEVAPIALRYGAHRYSVQRSLDDRYRITQMSWFERKEDWYKFWDGPEMIEFRARYSAHYQIPIEYGWYEEEAAGEMGPEVPLEETGTAPEPQPQAAGSG